MPSYLDKAGLEHLVQKMKSQGGSTGTGSVTYDKLANPMTQINDFQWNGDNKVVDIKNTTMMFSGLSNLVLDQNSALKANGASNFYGPAQFYEFVNFGGPSRFVDNVTINALLDASSGGVKLPDNSVTESNLSTDVRDKLNSSGNINMYGVVQSKSILTSDIKWVELGYGFYCQSFYNRIEITYVIHESSKVSEFHPELTILSISQSENRSIDGNTISFKYSSDGLSSYAIRKTATALYYIAPDGRINYVSVNSQVHDVTLPYCDKYFMVSLTPLRITVLAEAIN